AAGCRAAGDSPRRVGERGEPDRRGAAPRTAGHHSGRRDHRDAAGDRGGGGGVVNWFRLPFGDWVESFADFITLAFGAFFDVLRAIFFGMVSAAEWVLGTPPFWAVILVAALVALLVRGWTFAVGTALGLLFIVSVAQWENAMDTLALVVVGTFIAVVLSIP